MAWEAARAYQHRFSCRRWSLITFKVCDFDSMSERLVLALGACFQLLLHTISIAFHLNSSVS